MAEQKSTQHGKSKAEALAQLEKQRHELSARIDAERAEVLAEIVDTAKAAAELIGVPLDELLKAFRKGGKSAAKVGAGTRAPAPAKYRNPKNPAETWSGRGKSPAWVGEATKAGATLESLTIGKPAQPA